MLSFLGFFAGEEATFLLLRSPSSALELAFKDASDFT
jgi:hypothetical protein